MKTPFPATQTVVTAAFYLLMACQTIDPLLEPKCPEGSAAVKIVRGPYLQSLSPTSVIVKWRTAAPTSPMISYRSEKSKKSTLATGGTETDHEVKLDGLTPATRYRYKICGQVFSEAELRTQYVQTSPKKTANQGTRIWIIGDSGSANGSARNVYEAYLADTQDNHTDVWLMLGDNAYNSGTDQEYQDAVFDMYVDLLPNTGLWSALGNHDSYSVTVETETGPYFSIFGFPTSAEAGGTPSGTETYYSFDYGNLHFISLDSQTENRITDSTMIKWLRKDLAATEAEWIVAFMHHPPYTKGTHDSDTEIRHVDVRLAIVPILEAFDVDLVLAGHSHVYERSWMLAGHYGYSDEFDPAMHLLTDHDGNPINGNIYIKSRDKTAGGGTVYAVVGNSGKIGVGTLDHPAMPISSLKLGSMILGISGSELQGRFLTSKGNVLDQFKIVKE